MQSFYQFTWWLNMALGVADHQGPPETLRISECMHQEEGMCKWFCRNYYYVYVHYKTVNENVCKIHYINRISFCTQHAWYFGGDSPLSIQSNKECLLLNTTLVLRNFIFTSFLVVIQCCFSSISSQPTRLCQFDTKSTSITSSVKKF